MRRSQLPAQQFGLESDADEELPEVVVQVVGNAALLARASLDYLALGQGAFCHLQLQAGVLLLDDCLELVALLPEGCDEQGNQRVNQKSRRRIPAINERSPELRAFRDAGGERCCSAGERGNETNSAAAKPCRHRYRRNIEERKRNCRPCFVVEPANERDAGQAGKSE